MLNLKVISSLIALVIFIKGYSQNITNPFETLKKKREIVYGLDNRRTHIYQHHTVIYGLYTGISFGKKLRFKIGINGTPFEIGKFVDQNEITKKNRLFFASIGEEFDFYQYKKFGMTTYLQAGMGNNFYRQLNQNGGELGIRTRDTVNHHYIILKSLQNQPLSSESDGSSGISSSHLQ